LKILNYLLVPVSELLSTMRLRDCPGLQEPSSLLKMIAESFSRHLCSAASCPPNLVDQMDPARLYFLIINIIFIRIIMIVLNLYGFIKQFNETVLITGKVFSCTSYKLNCFNGSCHSMIKYVFYQYHNIL
jgi:hypothetical protein